MSKWINTIAIAGMIATVLACTTAEATPLPTRVTTPTNNYPAVATAAAEKKARRIDASYFNAEQARKQTAVAQVGNVARTATAEALLLIHIECKPATYGADVPWIIVESPDVINSDGKDDNNNTFIDDAEIATRLCFWLDLGQIAYDKDDREVRPCEEEPYRSEPKFKTLCSWNGKPITDLKKMSVGSKCHVPKPGTDRTYAITFPNAYTQDGCEHKVDQGLSHEDALRKPYQGLACPVVEAAIEAKEAAIEDAWEAFSAGTTSYESYKLEESRKANYTVWVMNASEDELKSLVDPGLAKYIHRLHFNEFGQVSESCSKDLESLECLRDVIGVAFSQMVPSGGDSRQACERLRQHD